MPEIKNTFLKGKMNKDLDERLIPNGEYRDALNVEVATSEGSDIGTVQNILGNHRLQDNIPEGFKCVGSIANEKTNKLYWFVSKYDVDAIIEYDLDNDMSLCVLADTKAGTADAVLKFFGNIITGINIIDNLLFWTDNRGEPKKINIDTCKAGTTDIETHTQLSFDSGSFHGITIELITDGTVGGQYLNKGEYISFEKTQMDRLLGYEYLDADTANIRHYRDGKFLGLKELTLTNNQAASGTGVFAELTTSTVDDWHIGDIIFGENVAIDIEEQHVTVIKPKPLNALSVKVNHSEQPLNTSKIPNLFETTFPRFSYRYKFRDGEYSPFAPFTQPVFNAKYPKDTSKSIDGSVSYTKDNAYDIKEPYNKAMVNSIHSVDLSNFITAQTPEDVVEIEILYKKEDSSVIYSINTIKHSDGEWHKRSDHEGIDIGTKKALDGQGYSAKGGYTKGKYIVTTENIRAALPANQLLRPWDNVPRKALAQEITGNRIVYGNYLQNYEIPYLPNVNLDYEDRKTSLSSFEFKGLPSIKSQRNYQLGVVLCDKYGRETPVFTSNDGAANVAWQDSTGNNNASKSNQLVASVDYEFPEWVDSLKFFVKQTSNEYYNLVMDRAWVTKSTYDLDNSEGHLWISFPSSDRNKISEDDYIILKKKIEPNASQVSFENKFKIIDIKNEAPDAIKYELVNYGTVANNGSQGGDATDLFDIAGLPAESPDYYDDATGRGTNTLAIDWSEWAGARNAPLISNDYQDLDGRDSINIEDLYVSWSRSGVGGGVSKKYKVISGFIGSDNYVLKLSTYISKADADIAHCFGDAAQNTTVFNAAGAVNSASQLDPASGLHPDLIFQVERKELKDTEDFSGKFFVKISKNQITNIIETGTEISNLDKYQVFAKNSAYYLHDDMASTSDGYIFSAASGGVYGLTNYNGDPQVNTGNNHHQESGTNHNDATGGVGTDTTMRMSDNHLVWEDVLKDMYDQTTYNRFFIDSVHMVAGQSDASDYAKYGCITWSGCTIGDDDSAENSSWSYPPLKTWITDFKDKEGLLSSDSVWYENNLISENLNTASADSDWNGLKVDGWVGPLQNVSRHTPETSTSLNDNHINGLEGLVTTVSDHTTGPRRWFSGMNGTETGIGQDTKTYANDEEEGRHFMHLSFLAPGGNLHNGNWDNIGDDDDAIYGPASYAANLQGIWGGGVFTGETKDETFGSTSGGNKWKHFPMEGNHDANHGYLPETPGPGVGQGYDLKYRELHERQWDPTFLHDNAGTFIGDQGNRIRDFIRKLHPGSKFRFNRTETPGSSTAPEIDTEVYTIKKVTVKKLYNHTSWRKAYNRYDATDGYDQDSSTHEDYKSVEETALEYLNSLADDGTGGDATELHAKIEEFGAADNRRLCYIIELDKNPSKSTSAFGNPISRESGNGMCGDILNDNYTDIEFLDPVQDIVLSDLSKFPAVWELDPKKQQADLDIYYEASSSIPVEINEQTNELFAPIGCRVEIINSSASSFEDDVYLESWDDNVATFYPGFTAYDGSDEIDYTNASFKFIREDGSYTIAEAGGQQLVGINVVSVVGYLKKDFIFKKSIGGKIKTGLPWYNCLSFGNGVESNRIKDDFNEVFITNGVKASTTLQETYEEERRENGLIYSGIYNSNSGINDLNQFIQAEKITKDLNPTYGSIQRLFSRNTDLVSFCEDKVVKILANKDAVFNADGNPNLTATENVLGQTVPFVGDYGISKNPESFASESYRAYFADKQRGAILRLSKDGLTPISSGGMHDWFRDNLSQHTSLIGTYDAYKENYNITLSDTHTENILFNTSIELGSTSTPIFNPGLNMVEDGLIYYGSNYSPLEMSTVENHSDFAFANDSDTIQSSVTVTNHAAIGHEAFQSFIASSTPPPAQIVTETAEVDYEAATYDTHDNLPDDGWWYDPRFTTMSGDIWGPSQNRYADGEVWSIIKRHMAYNTHQSGEPVNTSSADYVDETNPTLHPAVEYSSVGAYAYAPDAGVEFEVHYPSLVNNTTQAMLAEWSGCITRTVSGEGGTDKCIVFDRVNEYTYTGSLAVPNFVEFQGIGGDANIGNPTNTNGFNGILQPYVDAGGSVLPESGDGHDSFFNGDEIHIEVELICYPTNYNVSYSDERQWGYNFIMPRIQLYDGSSPVDSSYLKTTYNGGSMFDGFQNQNNTGYLPYATYQTSSSDSLSTVNLGSDFVSPNSLGATSYTNLYCIKGYQSTSSVVFPSTESISSLNNDGSPAVTTKKTVKIGCSFKFIDDNQQNSNGTKKSGVANIEEVMVVNDLRIRISNALPGSGDDTSDNWITTNGYSLTGSTAQRQKNPLWEIKNVKIKKGFGVIAPSTAYTPTLYDDPSTPGTNEGWTLAQLQAAYGPGGTIADGTLALVDDGNGNTVYAINGVAVNTTPSVTGQPAIPGYNIPAWVEVNHGGLDDYQIATNIGSGGIGYGTGTTETSTQSWFGPNNIAVSNSSGGYNWVEPPNFTPLPITYPVAPNTTPGTSSTYDSPLGTSFNATSNFTLGQNASLAPVGIGTATPYNGLINDYFEVEHTVDPSSTPIHLPGISPSYNTTDWYLVDIEYDHPDASDINNMPSIGSGVPGNATDGIVEVAGVADPSGVNDTTVDSNGVGTFGGGASSKHVRCVPTWRTEYGTPKWVLRAIFQVHPNSDVASNAAPVTSTTYLDVFTLRFYTFINSPIKVQKIISRNISQDVIGGEADNWSKPSIYNPYHTFSNGVYLNASADKSNMYYHNNTLTWENVPQDDGGGSNDASIYKQTFSTPIPETTQKWMLQFTVKENAAINPEAFSGELGVRITTSNNGATLPLSTGIQVEDIDQVGKYKIEFNLDNINLPTVIAQPEFANASTAVLPAGSYADEIYFYNADSSTNLTGGVRLIELTDLTEIFTGNSVASWNLSGFTPSIEEYIIWNNGTIQFQEAPLFDDTFSGVNPVMINQLIESPINRYEQYRIQFTCAQQTVTGTPGNGELNMYYFNAEGYGFRISNIGGSAIYNGNPASYVYDSATGIYTFDQLVSITELAQSEIDDINVQALRNTIVIRTEDDGDPSVGVTAWIDNISMLRVYSIDYDENNDPIYPETTVTFNEKTNGWTSFKSFIPESGVSLSKKYFTFKEAKLYQHYVPTLNNLVVSNNEEADNYNVFYDTSYPSTIKAVLNAEPSLVKTFNTLNYEGSQAYVTKPTNAIHTATGKNMITIDNEKAWTSGANIEGWNVTEIKTDLDNGNLKEFIKKEGKWFGYIKGKGNGTLDTSKFSVQGIGIATSITI